LLIGAAENAKAKFGRPVHDRNVAVAVAVQLALISIGVFIVRRLM
jgi:hypothetical protein